MFEIFSLGEEAKFSFLPTVMDTCETDFKFVIKTLHYTLLYNSLCIIPRDDVPLSDLDKAAGNTWRHVRGGHNCSLYSRVP